MDIEIPSHFRLAKNISRYSPHKKKMGCVIVKNGHPIAVGHNNVKTNPNAWRNGLHAEMSALNSVSHDTNLDGASIFVYRERKDGSIGLARPCADCLRELKTNGFKMIWYTTPEYPYFNVERI